MLFRSYESKYIHTTSDKVSILIECYQEFGWVIDENYKISSHQQPILRLKRDRHLVNKTELTRLQRKFETVYKEILQLEKAKSSVRLKSKKAE